MSKRTKKTESDLQECGGCGFEFDCAYEEWGVCGQCDTYQCESCFHTMHGCDYCEHKLNFLTTGKHPTCCRRCSVQCEECTSRHAFFHPDCLPLHKLTCTKNSKLQRVLDDSTFMIRMQKKDLKTQRKQLLEAQQKIVLLESDIERLTSLKKATTKELKTLKKAEELKGAA